MAVRRRAMAQQMLFLSPTISFKVNMLHEIILLTGEDDRTKIVNESPGFPSGISSRG